MEWYKHDTAAMNDAKIKKLIMRHGPTGYAIYFHCLELIAGDISKSNLTFQLEHDAEIIADNLKVQGTQDESAIDVVNRVMRTIIELKLFESANGTIYCFKLLKRLDSSMTSNYKFRELITEAKTRHDTVMTPSCFSHDTVMQDKNRIEENRREEKRRDQIENFPTRLEKTIKHWNNSGLPEFRGTSANIHRLSEINMTFQQYTHDEVMKSINNYSVLIKSPDHDCIKNFKFDGFLSTGVQQYADSAKPHTYFLTKKGKAEKDKTQGFEMMVAACKAEKPTEIIERLSEEQTAELTARFKSLAGSK